MSFQALKCSRGLDLKLLNSLKPERALLRVKVLNQTLVCFRGLGLTLLSPLKHLSVCSKFTGPLLSPWILQRARSKGSEPFESFQGLVKRFWARVFGWALKSFRGLSTALLSSLKLGKTGFMVKALYRAIKCFSGLDPTPLSSLNPDRAWVQAGQGKFFWPSPWGLNSSVRGWDRPLWCSRGLVQLF